MTHHLHSPAARVAGGSIPILGAPSASAAAAGARQRASYHLIAVERHGDLWSVKARARGLELGGVAIVERQAPAV